MNKDKDLPYTASIIDAVKIRVLEIVVAIPNEINTTNDFQNGEHAFRLKVIEAIKKEIK